MENSVFYHCHLSIVTGLRYLASECVSFLFLQKFRRAKEEIGAWDKIKDRFLYELKLSLATHFGIVHEITGRTICVVLQHHICAVYCL